MVAAAEPWSPRTHALWGPAARRRAAELCRLGYQLAALPAVGNSRSFLDVWLAHLLPLAVTRGDERA